MESFEKFGQTRKRIRNHGVPMIGHRADCVKQNPCPFGRQREAVFDDLIREP